MTKSAFIQEIEAEQIKTDIPQFSIGDTINVYIRIIEGDKERMQVYSGTVIARRGQGLSETITVYRVSYGSSMERIFNLHSPRIAKIEVARRGRVRRSKLFYLRGKQGKKSKVQEQIYGAKGSISLMQEVEQETVNEEVTPPAETNTTQE